MFCTAFIAASLQDAQNKLLIEWASSVGWEKFHAVVVYKLKMINNKCNKVVFRFLEYQKFVSIAK